MKISKICDNIKNIVLKEFDKRDNRETDKLSIIGDDYHNRMAVAQELERLKYLIYPYFKKCKYCGEPFDLNKVAYRGDIFHCRKYDKCGKGWEKDTFSPEQLEWFNQFKNVRSAGFIFDGKGKLKDYHVGE